MKRKEITAEELDERIERHGPNVAMSNVRVTGIAVIKDKDGNIKQELKISSLEFHEDIENAASNGTEKHAR